ncbi:hypothetical protein D3C87_843980 [compost metagenome]
MRQRGVDVLLVGLRRDGRVEQQAVFEGEDGAPVFHGAEELAAARRGDVVELGQRVAHAEIIVVFAQQGGRLVEREAALRQRALLRDDAYLRAVAHGRGPLEVAQAEEQQIRRHARRGGEAHVLGAIAQVLAAGDRHVPDGHLAARDDHVQREGGLVVRFVPRRQHAARVGIFELRVQRALAALRRVVVEREQARGLRADLAAVVDAQQVLALGQRLGKMHGRRLLVRIEIDLARHLLAAARAFDGGGGKRQVQGIEGDAACRRVDGDLDGGCALEGGGGGVRRDRQRIVQRRDAARQLRGGRGGVAGRGVSGGGCGVAHMGRGHGSQCQDGGGQLAAAETRSRCAMHGMPFVHG